MMQLNEFLSFIVLIVPKYDIYIKFKDAKKSISLDDFINKNPYTWRLYNIYCIKPDNNDLIIEVNH